jgi:hypothetical protein
MKDRERQPDEHESRAAVALTVAWMLTCMSTAVAMLVVSTLRLLIVAYPVPAGGIHPLARIAGVLLFVGLATGALCLLFTPLVHRARGVAPPRAITIGAILIGLSPMVMLIVLTIGANR